MKLGFFLRKKLITLENIVRRFVNISNYLFWFLFSINRHMEIDITKIKTILIHENTAIGDFMNSLGVINQFKKKYPNIKILFLTKEKYLSISNKNTNIFLASIDPSRLLIEKPDAVILLGVPEKEIIYKLLKIPLIIKMELDTISDNLKTFFINLNITKRNFPRKKHRIKKIIECFELIGFKFPYKLIVKTSKSDKIEAKNFYETINSKNKKVILLNPFSGTSEMARKNNLIPSHDWPFENFAKLADYFSNQGYLVLITGIHKDISYASKLISRTSGKNIFNICGKFSIMEFIEFMKLCNLIISIDTGTVHMATQAGIPTIDLMGPYDPYLYCAWDPLDKQQIKTFSIFHKEVCSKCRKFYCAEKNPICMDSISVEEVLELSEKIIK
jgi:ADP-heptose:LPS heptosyltransferase